MNSEKETRRSKQRFNQNLIIFCEKQKKLVIWWSVRTQHEPIFQFFVVLSELASRCSVFQLHSMLFWLVYFELAGRYWMMFLCEIKWVGIAEETLFLSVHSLFMEEHSCGFLIRSHCESLLAFEFRLFLIWYKNGLLLEP